VTIQIKARDLAFALAILAVGVIIGLSFRPAVSRAQNLQCEISAGGVGSAYMLCGDRVWHCSAQECRQARFP
jgi:hypothetical protein